VEEGEGEGEELSIFDNKDDGNDDGDEDSISDARGLE
jgi:hypothetical protein